jgi:hypothetical protein
MTDARELSIALGGRWYGRYGASPCPVCQRERRKSQNALTLADGRNGRLVLNCKKSGCEFVAILTAAGLRSSDYRAPDPAAIAKRNAEEKAYAEKRAAQAERLWQQAQPIAGTLAETYLRGRGITCVLPATLRFHPRCWHGATAKRFPAMVAAVQGVGSPAVHRTYLCPDGTGKANIEPAKAMLGATGGGAVRLSEGQSRLVVSEGIESGLSLLCGLLDGPATLWAALSTSGIRRLHLPHEPGKLVIAADGDTPGRDAANALGTRAHALGWQVSFLRAPDGRDWNDILQERAPI